jgi:hypothetical protein
MNMKWLIIFCCLIILVLGGLLAVNRYFYQQDALEYRRLLVEAESLRAQDNLTANQTITSLLTIASLYEEDIINLRNAAEEYYLSYHSERTTTSQLSAQLEREKAKSASLTEALDKALLDSVYRARPFKDLEQLNEYLKGYAPGARYFGTTYIDGHSQCVAFATHLMLDALAHGFIIDTEIDENNEHAVGKTIIDGHYYFIEPSTKEIFREMGGTRWKVGE